MAAVYYDKPPINGYNSSFLGYFEANEMSLTIEGNTVAVYVIAMFDTLAEAQQFFTDVYNIATRQPLAIIMRDHAAEGTIWNNHPALVGTYYNEGVGIGLGFTQFINGVGKETDLSISDLQYNLADGKYFVGFAFE